MTRGQQKVLKLGLWMLGLCMVGYIVGRPLYWQMTESLSSADHHHRKSLISCPLCNCDCSSQPLLSLLDGLTNYSFTDCMKHDPVTEDSEKNFTGLLLEELQLHEAQALENQQRANIMLLEAKKMTSQFQKEADKCSSGMETCEEAREKSEAALETQKSQTAMWELRARQRGWRDGDMDRIETEGGSLVNRVKQIEM